MSNRIPSSVPFFSKDDIEYILSNFKEILEGGSFLTMHNHGENFENMFSDYVGSKYSIACNSGTSALEIILRSVDIKGKDMVLPSNTFIATILGVMNAGGNPILVDCNDDMCISYEDVVNKCTKNTVAVICVHIGGVISSDVFKIKDFCKENKIFLFEDAAQSHGSKLNSTYAGNIGDAAAFSFFSTKVLTTGEGGMITTSNDRINLTSKSLREFGKSPDGIATNLHTKIGYNWRMPEVSALMGIRQLASIDKFISKRQKISDIYDDILSDLSIKRISQSGGVYNNFKYIVDLCGRDRDKIHYSFLKKNIQPSGYVYEVPLHKQPILKKYHNLSLDKSEYYAENHFCLPIYYSLTEKDAVYIASFFKKLL